MGNGATWITRAGLEGKSWPEKLGGRGLDGRQSNVWKLGDSTEGRSKLKEKRSRGMDRKQGWRATFTGSQIAPTDKQGRISEAPCSHTKCHEAAFALVGIRRLSKHGYRHFAQ
eukprot:scaffold192531_cov17-Tisochrysis_lutea.AAC.1